MKPRVLCVDDDPAVLEGLALGLRRTAVVETASCVAEALQCLAGEKPYWVVISDMHLPGMSGSQLLNLLKKRSPLTQRILLTGSANLELALNAINSGEVYRFLTKPCPPELVRDSVTSAAQAYAQRAMDREASYGASRGTLQSLLELCTDFDKRAVTRALRFRARTIAVATSLGCQSVEMELAALTYGLLQSLTIGGRTRELVEVLLMRIAQSSVALRSAMALLRDAEPGLFEGMELPQVTQFDEGLDGHTTTVLRALCELDAIEATTPNTNVAMDRLLRSGTAYTKQVIHALNNACLSAKDVRAVPLLALDSGMLLAADIRTKDGALLLTKDTVLTDSMLDRLLEYRDSQLAQPVHVWSTN